MARPPQNIINQDDEYHRQGLRQCRSCEQVLPVSSFHKQHRNRHGLRLTCKDCTTQSNRLYDHKARANDELIAWGDALHAAGLRVCKACGHEGPIGDFFTHPNYRHGYDSRCKACAIGSRYGLTGPEYRAMPSTCEICDTVEDLVVDHCHETGKVRGTLCRRCNSALGMFQDNPDILERGRMYLSGHKAIN